MTSSKASGRIVRSPCCSSRTTCGRRLASPIGSCCCRPGRDGSWRSSPWTSSDPGASTHPRYRAWRPRSPITCERRCAVMLDVDVADRDRLGEELAGLDALELADSNRPSLARRIWTATWPKLGAVVIALGLWQLVVWSGWKPEYVLPGPATVFAELRDQLADGRLQHALWLTLGRA